VPKKATGRTLWLRLDGVNFRFDAWLNGKKIADAAKTTNAFKIHEIDVTAVAKPNANTLAILVSTPKPNDLAITFVD
jgi:beta-galactosidase/beta-glucuronidase